MIENTENQSVSDSKGNESESKSRWNFILDILRGGIWNHPIIFRNRMFILMWFFLALFYIYNRFQAEDFARERVRIEKEVKNLRSELLSLQSELNMVTRQSGLIDKMKKQPSGLRSAINPPFKLEPKKSENDD
jgi:hypothetical protein